MVTSLTLGDVVGLDLLQNLGVDAHLAVSAILVAASMNAKQAKLSQAKAKTESREDSYGENEDYTLEDLRHTHRRGSP